MESITVYIILLILIGDRSGPLSLILAILIFIGHFIRKFKLSEVLILTLIGGFLLTIVGLGRSDTSGIGMFEAGITELREASEYDPTLELANSVRTLNSAVSYINKNNNQFFYGSMWVADFLSPFPFAQTFYLKLTGIKPHTINSSSFITFLYYGKGAPSGEGTSLIADIYLNFGVIGIAFFMFLLGMFIKNISYQLLTPSSMKWIIMAAIFCGMSFYYSRSSYFMFLRDVVWGLLLFNFLVKAKKRV